MKKVVLFILGAGLTACSSFSPQSWSSETILLEQHNSEDQKLNDLIRPYRDSISEVMDKVIGWVGENLIKQRPCANLNNWAADALLYDQEERANQLQPNMALLNVGGLRSSINQGEITVGDVFSLMPFDNEVVWVKMPIAALDDLAAHFVKSGGEPIAGAVFRNGKIDLNQPDEKKDHFWIVTSDYLLNGGDNMTFFEKKLEVVTTNKLLRDSFLDEVIKQDTLRIDPICRIHVEQ